eukprot:2333944-Amphidinium_carterae.1
MNEARNMRRGLTERLGFAAPKCGRPVVSHNCLLSERYQLLLPMPDFSAFIPPLEPTSCAICQAEEPALPRTVAYPLQSMVQSRQGVGMAQHPKRASNSVGPNSAHPQKKLDAHHVDKLEE